MGAVHLAPRLRQLQDLLDLLVQQAVDRATTGGPILKRASHPPDPPAAHPPLGHLQHSAGALHGEPLGDGLVDQLQQRVLGGGGHARRNAADQPQRDFPRSSISSIACSLTASPSRWISARAAASSRSSRACRTPGLEAASASSAPCLATWRMRMTVDRSIPKRSAASLWLSSPVTSCSHSSYFSVGLRNRLARRPSRSRRGSCWVISTLLLGAGGPYRMRRNQNPDVGHEVSSSIPLGRRACRKIGHGRPPTSVRLGAGEAASQFDAGSRLR